MKMHMNGAQIDLLAGAPRSSRATAEWVFEGRKLRIDTPRETILKRSSTGLTFKVRNLFDVAAVVDSYPDELWIMFG